MVWITTSNVSEEAWRYVMEFANLDLAIEAISKRHGKPTPSTLADYKKQAAQIRAAIIQATEYFDAAKTSTLATSPNHLYYGMSALGTALMLLYGDGSKSLDYLRAHGNSNHHGLEFSTGADRKNCQKGLELLEKSFVTIRNDGHFLNWYSTLPTAIQLYGEVKQVIARTQETNTNRSFIGTEGCATVAQMKGRKQSILESLQYIPDLRMSLGRYGAIVPNTRANYKSTFTQTNNNQQTRKLEWTMHNAGTPKNLFAILSQFRVPPRNVQNFYCNAEDESIGCVVRFTTIEGEVDVPNEPNFHWPSIRYDMNQELIMYAKSLDTYEFVDAYLCAFGLSMLSRYFPDIWITCLDSHCKATKIIERLVEVLIAKAPLMAASLLANEDLVISTQRPSWFM